MAGESDELPGAGAGAGAEPEAPKKTSVADDIKAEATRPLTRDEAREMIFNARAARTPITLFGVPLDLVEPPLGVLLEAQDNPSKKVAVAQLIVQYSYLRGTQEPV